VPDELPDAVLAPVNCAMSTVMQGLLTAGVGEDQYVVIQGAGGLGLTAAAIAKDMGAARVIVLDRLAHRLALARQFGADETIDITAYDTSAARIERVRELTFERGADVVLELVGSAGLLPEGVAMLRNGGTFVEIGNIVPDSKAEIYPSQLLRGKKIVGSLMYRPSIIPMVLSFLVKTKGKYPFEKMVSHRARCWCRSACRRPGTGSDGVSERMGRRRRARGGGEELWALAARLLAHMGHTERGRRGDPATWVLGEWTFCPAVTDVQPDVTAWPLGVVWRPPNQR
jgi:hypothetical protein